MDFDDVDCIFVGGIPHEDDVKSIHNKSIIQPQFAAERFQGLIFDSLKKLSFSRFAFLSFPYTGVYGLHTRMFRFLPSKAQDNEFRYFKFSTIPFLYSLSRALSLILAVRKVLKERNGNRVLVFVYAVHFPFLFAVNFCRLFVGSDFKVILITPDLPQYTSSRAGILGLAVKFCKSLQGSLLYYLARKSDGHIVFSEPISEVIKAPRSPHYTLLGLPPKSSKSLDDKITKCFSDLGIERNARIVFYGGGLSDRYGVRCLVDAFIELISINDNCVLILCGLGDTVPYIKSVSKKFPRIKYLGVLENSEVLEIQKHVSVLVNPRTSQEAFAKYSFPSKMIEYAYAGKPIVGYKLPTYPKELLDAMIIPAGLGAGDLKKAIYEAINLSESDILRIRSSCRKFLNKYCSDESVINGLKMISSKTLRQ